MSEAQNPAIEWIIANTIQETARGDPDALAGRIIAALAQAGYRIVSRKSLIALPEDSAEGSQPFDELTREKRPQGASHKLLTAVAKNGLQAVA